MRVLVVGATGYIGSLLVPRLVSAGHQVRILARNPGRAAALVPAGCEIVAADVLKPATLPSALAQIEAAYYLVHSLKDDEFSFEELDRQGARNFAQAAAAGGLQRIIYLGGLGDTGNQLSPHLRSRHEVGALLAAAGVPVTEFRAGIILGARSIPFEMLRELTERLPVTVCPRWVTSPIQPIAVEDALRYLVTCLDISATAGRVLEIGGPEVLTYQAMMERFAQLAGLHRVIVRVPVLTPRLSSYWVDIVTSTPAPVARSLIEGLKSAVVVRDPLALSLLPMELTPFDAAVHAALAAPRPRKREAPFRWLRRLPARVATLARQRLWPGVFTDRRAVQSTASPGAVYAAITSIGGPNGWYFMNWAWLLRGLLDRLWGGPGLDRRTPLSGELRIGDRRDVWQVLEVVQGQRLRLGALMRMPGAAELEWLVMPHAGGSALHQTARFRPTGIPGRLYWYGLLPMHRWIFAGMARAIVRRAEHAAPPASA